MVEISPDANTLSRSVKVIILEITFDSYHCRYVSSQICVTKCVEDLCKKVVTYGRLPFLSVYIK